MSLIPYLHRVVSGASLSADEARDAMTVLLEGRANDAEVAGFLVALRMKGETASELAGFARAMRDKVIRVDAGPDVIDIVGTGGDAAGTFNISSVAAIVLAGAGLRVAKHGNRAISGRVGSADVFEALGVRIAMSPEEAACAVRQIGLGFLFAPHLHPAMKHAQPVRRSLKMRTAFNLLGPLANPAGAQVQVIGAPSPDAAAIMAAALHELGTRRSFVVHGSDGLDEISTTGMTEVYEVCEAGITRHLWTPEEFGVPRVPLSALAGGHLQENAETVLSILRGEHGAKRDIVLVNSAAALLASGTADTLSEGMKRAAESIDSGSALKVLEQLRNIFPAT
jgi:anthranilate phosphoribosyltransferase